MVANTSYQTTSRRMSGLFARGLIFALVLLLVGMTLFSSWVFLRRMERLYQGYIYPNVTALGVDLSAMTLDEAAAALNSAAANVDTGTLILTDGDQRWTYTWAEAGMHVDAMATVQAAYTVGRTGRWREQLEVWLAYQNVAPRFAFDAVTARGLLDNLSQQVSVPPIDPTLRLENGEVVVVPGEAGRMLNVTNTLVRLQGASGSLQQVIIPLEFEIVEPAEPDTEAVKAQAEVFLSRSITLSAYDVLTEETLNWTLGRETIATWLHLVPGATGEPTVDINLYKLQESLVDIAEDMGDGRGFRFEEAAQQVFNAFNAGEDSVTVYLTHPERPYVVQPGDTLTNIGERFGMPSGLIAEANPDIDYDRLSVGQQIIIPSQDILTPYMPIPDKKIVVSLAEQRVRVYENGALLYDWITSTGIPSSPTHRGTFQVLSKHEEAYASQWDLWMPYFIAVYSAGGGVENGFHELPILPNGQRLWAGSLGRPASFGCIILGIPDAQTLYDWAEVGVVVVIG